MGLQNAPINIKQEDREENNCYQMLQKKIKRSERWKKNPGTVGFNQKCLINFEEI